MCIATPVLGIRYMCNKTQNTFCCRQQISSLTDVTHYLIRFITGAEKNGGIGRLILLNIFALCWGAPLAWTWGGHIRTSRIKTNKNGPRDQLSFFWRVSVWPDVILHNARCPPYEKQLYGESDLNNRIHAASFAIRECSSINLPEDSFGLC